MDFDAAAAAAPHRAPMLPISVFSSTARLLPRPRSEVALLAPRGQRSMVTLTKASSAVLAGAPTTSRSSRSMTAASSWSG